LPVLNQESTDERPLIWHFPIYLEAYNGLTDGARDVLFRTRPGSIIRMGKWKLHQYFEKNEIELYNLEVDQGETNNIAESNPDIVNSLIMELESWRKERNAPVPSELNPEYDAIFEAARISKTLSKK
jgi:hypothetical protein